MEKITAKSILSKDNVFNIYRGCTHGCIYCDSRSECYGMTCDFENIKVKINAPELMEKSLVSKRKKCVVSSGAMGDPYCPLEKELGITRQCLEIINKYDFGVSLLTKSSLVLRDTDLLQAINEKCSCYVQMTMTTYDNALCKVLEPNAPTTKERFEALLELKDKGIPTVVWFTPIMPYINDSKENAEHIIDYCVKAGVKGVLTFGGGMTLRSGNREYFFKKLDEHFPDLKKKYIRGFGLSYGINTKEIRALNGFIKRRCEKHGIVFGTKQVMEMTSTYQSKCKQFSFFE